MIVFLLRPGAQFVSGFQPESSNVDGWRSANWIGDMRFSATWLRNGEVFGFFAISDADTSRLYDLDVTEQEFRAQIAKSVQLRASLDEALSLPPDSLGRALQLAALVRSDDPAAPRVALKWLAESGPSGEIVRRELEDWKLANSR